VARKTALRYGCDGGDGKLELDVIAPSDASLEEQREGKIDLSTAKVECNVSDNAGV
jgi:hypothetical protein